MRIVSLLPSTTEIVCALGLRDQLVAVSHACDFPADIDGLPRVTRPAPARAAAPPDAPSSPRARRPARPPARAVTETDTLVSAEIGGWRLDPDALREVHADLVLLGDAEGAGRGQAVVRAALDSEEPTIVAFDPLSLEGVFHTITTIGAMTEAEDEAVGLLEMLREDLGALEERAVKRHDEGIHSPRVVVLQGFDPPMAAGRWIPDLVRRAGGWELLGREGERSVETSWEAVLELEPEMLFLAPCGLGFEGAQAAWTAAARPGFWRELDAVQRGDVFVVEPVYFCRPGPRIVGAVGMLAEIFDPDGFVDTSPPYSWTPLFE